MRNNWMITEVRDKASNDHDYFNLLIYQYVPIQFLEK
jgi:hypothetical protein